VQLFFLGGVLLFSLILAVVMTAGILMSLLYLMTVPARFQHSRAPLETNPLAGSLIRDVAA
jgi:hypothetical protein